MCSCSSGKAWHRSLFPYRYMVVRILAYRMRTHIGRRARHSQSVRPTGLLDPAEEVTRWWCRGILPTALPSAWATLRAPGLGAAARPGRPLPPFMSVVSTMNAGQRRQPEARAGPDATSSATPLYRWLRPSAVGDHRELEVLAVAQVVGALAARRTASQRSSQGPWLMSRQCSVTMSSWAPMTVSPSSHRGIVRQLVDLRQASVRAKATRACAPKSAACSSESRFVSGTCGPTSKGNAPRSAALLPGRPGSSTNTGRPAPTVAPGIEAHDGFLGREAPAGRAPPPAARRRHCLG